MSWIIILYLLISPLVVTRSDPVDSFCPPHLLKTADIHNLQVQDGLCFQFFLNKRKTYSDANTDCTKDGGTLALPKTKSLNDYLTDTLVKDYSIYEETWIGLRYNGGDTRFLWEDNSELEWDNFAPGDGPDNDWLTRNDEECVSIDPGDSGLWHDYDCDILPRVASSRDNPSKLYICQYHLVSGDASPGTSQTQDTVDTVCPPDLQSSVDFQYLHVWNGSCFHFVVNKRETYSAANIDCLEEGGTLALPKTASLNEFLTETLEKQYDMLEEIWIGLRDQKGDTQFLWEDNSAIEWNNFAKGKGPDDDWLTSSDEECVALDSGDRGLWYNYRCENTLQAVVTRTNPSKPYVCQYVSADTDGRKVDEKDKDLTIDVVQDDSRTIDNTCPPTLLNTAASRFLQVKGDTCLHFVLDKLSTYSDARADCMKDGGTLVLSKTKSLNDYLTHQMSNYYGQSGEAWIGLHDVEEELKFVWEDNTQLRWNNFAKSNGLYNDWLREGVKDCVALDPNDKGKWYDYPCGSDSIPLTTGSDPRKQYICQYTSGGRDSQIVKDGPPVQDDPSIEDDSSVVDDTGAKNHTDTPITDDTAIKIVEDGETVKNGSLLDDDTPVKDHTPVVDETPNKGDTPATDSKPVGDDTPFKDEPPFRDDTPVEDDSQLGDDLSVQDGRNQTADVTTGDSNVVFNICPPDLLDNDFYYLQARDGMCFYFAIHRRKTYRDATRDCGRHSGTLALPKTKPLNDYLSDQMLTHYRSPGDVWIGLHDKKEEEKFIWQDNTELQWNNFAWGNGPHNNWLARDAEDCVALNPGDDGQWHDHPCEDNLGSFVASLITQTNAKKMYICQYMPSDKVVDDPSVDGKDGGQTAEVTPDMPINVESTCPSKVLTTTDPRYIQIWEGICFHFVVTTWKSYGKANHDCRGGGGTLALPKTKLLNDYLTDKLLNFYKAPLETWVGLNDKQRETEFVWEDNSRLRWNNFDRGEGPETNWPARDVEDCVALHPRRGGRWYDRQCDDNLLAWATRSKSKKQYICQYNP